MYVKLILIDFSGSKEICMKCFVTYENKIMSQRKYPC